MSPCWNQWYNLVEDMGCCWKAKAWSIELKNCFLQAKSKLLSQSMENTMSPFHMKASLVPRLLSPLWTWTVPHRYWVETSLSQVSTQHMVSLLGTVCCWQWSPIHLSTVYSTINFALKCLDPEPFFFLKNGNTERTQCALSWICIP